MDAQLTADQGFAIAGRAIGPDHPPFVIAELSGNHNGDIDRALRLIEAAAQAGADAVKLQTYTPDTITLAHDGPGFVLEGGLWAGRTLYDLYGEAQTPWDWHEPLFAHARALGLIAFSSPFDDTAIDLLEATGRPRLQDRLFRSGRPAADRPRRPHRQAADRVDRHDHARRDRRCPGRRRAGPGRAAPLRQRLSRALSVTPTC